MKYIIIILSVLLFSAKGNEEDFRIIDSIAQEKECTQLGGSCTIAADCPKGHLAEKPNLCPLQRKQGIECCHGWSLKETRCEKHGGICMNDSVFCSPQLIYEATDCPKNTKCCILV